MALVGKSSSAISQTFDTTQITRQECSRYEKSWSQNEKEAWHSLCESGFYTGEKHEKQPPISSEFLQTITKTPPYRDILKIKGLELNYVDIKGDLKLSELSLPFLKMFRFKSERIELSKLSIKNDLYIDIFVGNPMISIDHSIIGNELTIGQGIIRAIEIDTTTVHGDVKIVNSEIGNLTLSSVHVEGRTEISGINDIKVDKEYKPGDLTIDEGQFDGDLSLNSIYADSLRIYNSILKKNLSFGSVHSPNDNAMTPSEFTIDRTSVTGSITLDNTRTNIFYESNSNVSGSVYITRSRLGHLIISHAKIKEDLRVFDSLVGVEYISKNTELPEGAYLSPVSVVGDILFLKSEITTKLTLDKAEVGGDLVFDSSRFNSVSAVQMKISNEFIIASTKESPEAFNIEFDPTQFEPWGKGGILNISYSSFNSIASPWAFKAWPQELNMQGVKVGSVRATDVPNTQNMPPEIWFPIWLELGTFNNFTSQPYKEISKILRDAGDETAAISVEYAAKERQRIAACKKHNITSCALLSTSKALIGYGYFIQRSLLWSTGFILLGAWVFRHTPEAKAAQMPIGLTYSFDMFIPLIKLRESNYHILIEGPQRYYFYLHKIAGWIMGSFIVVGLSGFAK
jgi:hypothetical protein